MIATATNYYNRDESETKTRTNFISEDFGNFALEFYHFQHQFFEVIEKEIKRIRNKEQFNLYEFRFENQYPTKPAPFIRLERRNRLIGKREKRIGLKR